MKIDETITWQEITPGGNIYEGGTSKHFKTGDWRTEKPVVDIEKCTQCLLCVPVCPDSAILMNGSERGEFNLDFCKGCGICAEVCRFDAINMVKER
jgi:pyruvate ferredoxin oxidoreductase delta subunit